MGYNHDENPTYAQHLPGKLWHLQSFRGGDALVGDVKGCPMIYRSPDHLKAQGDIYSALKVQELYGNVPWS